MTPKWFNLKIVLGYWNENMNQNFRFNNPKQCSNWIILVSFCSSRLAIKNCYNIHFKKNLKNRLKIQKSLCITTKTWTFKGNYLENYNDSEHAVKTKNALFFMNFPNINNKMQFFSHGLVLNDNQLSSVNWTSFIRACRL